MEKRILTAVYIALSIFALLLFRLWYLQVVKGDEYKNIAEHNRLRFIDIPAPRGIIYDRNGTVLVNNIPSFDISVVREDFPDDDVTVSELGQLLGLDPSAIRKRLDAASGLVESVKLKQDVLFDEVARVEARKMDFPGLRVDVMISREYLYWQFASHAIGYLGRLTLDQAKDPDYRNVPREAFIGQWGAEKVYDMTLRGTPGKKAIEVDATGRVIKVIGNQEFVKGDDLTLTIDVKLQSEAEYALAGNSGAVVALDPLTGAVLALASAPSFDPNLFARGISYEDWKLLAGDPFKPFFNRAIQSQHPPGSTFKIVSAIAALERGVIRKDTSFFCSGSIKVGREFRCWKKEGHGQVDLHRAIVESCDVYFYEVARRVGIDTLEKYALQFGLGRVTGIELDGERPGFIPSKEWKQKTKKQKWFLGETLNTVIGQGYITVTPLQMASLMAAVVNGGRFFRPHILEGDVSAGIAEREIHISPGTIDLIRQALEGVVSEPGGTGGRARSGIVSIGGKTGTAQVVGGNKVSERYRDHAWFVAYAPAENPRIVVCVFVEHGGHGGAVAAPIAKSVIEAYFKDKAREEADAGSKS